MFAKYILIYIFLFTNIFVLSQKTIVRGVVYDYDSKETIIGARIEFTGTKSATKTDIDGNFNLETYYSSDSIIVSSIGYTSSTFYVKQDDKNRYEIYLKKEKGTLNEVVITGQKYEKDKPAIQLIKKVIKNKHINNKEKLNSYEFETYNKVEIDLNNISEDFIRRKVFKNIDFIFNNLDTINEKAFLPIFISESLTDFYFIKNPKKKKEIIKATKIAGTKNESLNKFIGAMYLDYNIYENNIDVFGKKFISPTNITSIAHYDFFITDSTYINGKLLIKLNFVPKHKMDLLFSGFMWINEIGYAIKSLEIIIPNDININYIKYFKLTQEFVEVEPEVWMLKEDNIIADINPIENSEKINGFFAKKTTSYRNIKVNKSYDNNLFKNNDIIVSDSVDRDEQYWEQHRHIKLTDKENNIYLLIDSLLETPVITNFINVVNTIISGYYIKNKIEIGPYFSMLSFNPIEKIRLGFGIRTSNNFSKNLMLYGQIYYGMYDQRFKYRGGLWYILKKSPRREIKMDYVNDYITLDNNVFETNSAGLFASVFRLNPLNKLTGVNAKRIRFHNEWKGGLSNFIEYRNMNYFTISSKLNYEELANDDNLNLISNEVEIGFRYAYKEKFIEGEFERISISSDKPIISGSLITSIGNIHNFQKLRFEVFDRLFLGYFGMVKYRVSFSKIIGKTYLPYLYIHKGNETLGYLYFNFNTMNHNEFVSDEYVDLFATYYLDGLVFNKIPLIRKLKWRENISLNMIYGGMRKENSLLMKLPYYSTTLEAKPFAEIGLGVSNIFKIFRIDVFKRLSYLKHNFEDINTSNWSIKASFQFEF